MGRAAGRRCTAFAGGRRIASGELREVARRAKAVIDRGERGPVLIFDDATSEPIEVDFRGSPRAVLERLDEAGSVPESEAAEPEHRGPGRPKLGVVAREVTMLPRHWDWLNSQPGGASVALRKLVDDARRVHAGRDKVRRAQETTYRFISSMAGDEPGFEEAARALFARDLTRFGALADAWPRDVAEHARRLAVGAGLEIPRS